jgi:Protein of unknown function (DUF3532)./Helix-turn-helix.
MKINNLWFKDEKIFILTNTDTTLWQSLYWYPRLLNANATQRKNYRINAYGIRWDEIDEDISFESFYYENKEPNNVAKIFRQHPELNVSAVARRLGMKQSLLAAYISGVKNPSVQRSKEIIDSLHCLGQELLSVY